MQSEWVTVKDTDQTLIQLPVQHVPPVLGAYKLQKFGEERKVNIKYLKRGLTNQ